MFVPYNYQYAEMLHQFITIYTSEFLMTMLFGVLFFLCLPVFFIEVSKSFIINNVTRLIPVISDSVFAGEQDRITESKKGFMHHTIPDKSQIRNNRHRLG